MSDWIYVILVVFKYWQRIGGKTSWNTKRQKENKKLNTVQSVLINN